MFMNLRPCYIEVSCANNQVMVCRQIGTLIAGRNGQIVPIPDSLYIPGCMTLFSVKQVTDMGFIVVFSQHTADIYKSETQLKNHKPFITSKKKLSDKLWHLEMKKPHVYKNSIDERKPKSKGDQVCANFLDKFAPDVSADRLHQRYIHYNLPYLQRKFPHLKNTKSLCWCDACTCMRGRTKISPTRGQRWTLIR